MTLVTYKQSNAGLTGHNAGTGNSDDNGSGEFEPNSSTQGVYVPLA